MPCRSQGRRSNIKIKEVKTNFSPIWTFPDCNSSLNSHMAMKWCTKQLSNPSDLPCYVFFLSMLLFCLLLFICSSILLLSSLMMTSSNGHLYRVTGPLWGELTGHLRIPLTKASDAELWYILWYAPKQTIQQTVEMTATPFSLWCHHIRCPLRTYRIKIHLVSTSGNQDCFKVLGFKLTINSLWHVDAIWHQ